MAYLIAYMFLLLFYQLGWVYLYYDWHIIPFLLLLAGMGMLALLKQTTQKNEFIIGGIALFLALCSGYTLSLTQVDLYIYFFVMYFISLISFTYTRNMH